jgi:hypothetical protein
MRSRFGNADGAGFCKREEHLVKAQERAEGDLTRIMRRVRDMPMLQRVYMDFLYGRSPSPLENICDKWHLERCPGVPGGFHKLLDLPQSAVLKASPLLNVGITRRKEHSMLDIIVLAIGLGFFALSVGYTIVCDRL